MGRVTPALLLLSALAACGPSTDPRAAVMVDFERGLRGPNRALGVTTALVAPGLLQLQTGADTVQAAAVIVVQVTTETNSCAAAVRTGSTVDVDFGNGCTLASANMIMKGKVSVTVTATTSPASYVIPVTYDGSVDSTPLAGNLTISTPDGTSYSFTNLDVVFGGAHVVVPALTGGSAAFAATLSGKNATLSGPSGLDNSKLTFDGVTERYDGCYPSAGTATLVGSEILTLTFDANTPKTGLAQLGVGMSTPATQALPARSACTQQ